MKPILTLLSSNILGVLVGGIFFLTASWYFDLASMGVYSVAISIQWIAVGVIGTGLSVAAIRVATDYLAKEEFSYSSGIIISAYILAAIFSLSLVGISIGLEKIYTKPSAISWELINLAFLWAGGRAMIDCLRSGMLIQRQYNRVAILMVLSAATGLLSLGVVLFWGNLTPARLLMAHAVGLGSCAVIGVSLLQSLWKHGIRVQKNRVIKLLKYAFWPALSEGMNLLQINLGPLLLLGLGRTDEAGRFSIGRYPAFLFGVVAISLYQYWLPEAVKENRIEHLLKFMKHQIKLAGMVSGALLIGALAIKPLLPLLGPNFAAAASLFVLNTVDFVLFLMVRPIETVYHSLYKPQLELVMRIARLAVLVVFAFWLAPRFGAVGMVWAHLCSGVAVMGLAVWLLCRQLGSFPFIWNILVEKSK